MAKLRLLLPDRFESLSQVGDQHQHLVRLLTRGHPEHPALMAFAACDSDHPCRLEGCPQCRRWFRRELVRETHRHGFDKKIWSFVTIIPRSWAIDGGKLANFSLQSFVARTSKALERSSELRDLVIIGGVDLSFEVHNNESGVWQLHLHLMVMAERTAELEHAFRSAFPPADGVRYPHRFDQVSGDGFFEALTYSYKNWFERNSHYDEGRLRRDGAPRRNSRSLVLPMQQQAELAAWLLHRPIGSRLILRNRRRTNKPNSKRLRFAMASTSAAAVNLSSSGVGEDPLAGLRLAGNVTLGRRTSPPLGFADGG